MKNMLLAAAAGMSLVASTVAYAGEGQGTVANTFFTELPGVVAQADVPNAPAYARNGQTVQQAQNGQGTQADVRSSHSPWLFPPIGKYLDQRAGG